MTREELDERIGVMLGLSPEHRNGRNPEIKRWKPLIRDCIEAVTPGRVASPYRDPKLAEASRLMNEQLDEIEANTKELLG